MADAKNQNDQAVVFDLADKPVIAYTVFPELSNPRAVQPRLHGGASFGVSESARSLSSAFVHQALLLRLLHSNLPGLKPESQHSNAFKQQEIKNPIDGCEEYKINRRIDAIYKQAREANPRRQ